MALTPYMLQRQQMKLKGAGKAASDPEPERTAKPKAISPKPAKAPKKASKAKPKIKRVSKKRASQERAYKPVRKKFLSDNPICQVDGCNSPSTDLHHKAGRSGAKLLEVDDFMAVCRKHHNEFEEKDKEARAAGYKKTRLGKIQKDMK